MSSIVVANWHSVEIAAEPNIVTLLVNIRTCNYNCKGLNETAFPAHLYLRYYMFPRPFSKFHSRPFARRSVYR